MSSTSKVMKVIFRVLVMVGVVGLLIIEEAAAAAAGENSKNHHLGSEKQIRTTVSKIEINYVSKRRIPNGPDPIHNRRAGNSHQPPGQA